MVITIYDVQGRKARELVDQELPAGFYRVQWDGRNVLGQLVASIFRGARSGGTWLVV